MSTSTTVSAMARSLRKGQRVRSTVDPSMTGIVIEDQEPGQKFVRVRWQGHGPQAIDARYVIAMSRSKVHTLAEATKAVRTVNPDVTEDQVRKWFDSGRLRGYRDPATKEPMIPNEHLVRFMRDHGHFRKGRGAVRADALTTTKKAFQKAYRELNKNRTALGRVEDRISNFKSRGKPVPRALMIEHAKLIGKNSKLWREEQQLRSRMERLQPRGASTVRATSEKRVSYLDFAEWRADAKRLGYSIKKTTASYNTHYQAVHKSQGVVGFYNTGEGTKGAGDLTPSGQLTHVQASASNQVSPSKSELRSMSEHELQALRAPSQPVATKRAAEAEMRRRGIAVPKRASTVNASIGDRSLLTALTELQAGSNEADRDLRSAVAKMTRNERVSFPVGSGPAHADAAMSAYAQGDAKQCRKRVELAKLYWSGIAAALGDMRDRMKEALVAQASARFAGTAAKKSLSALANIGASTVSAALSGQFKRVRYRFADHSSATKFLRYVLELFGPWVSTSFYSDQVIEIDYQIKEFGDRRELDKAADRFGGELHGHWPASTVSAAASGSRVYRIEKHRSSSYAPYSTFTVFYVGPDGRGHGKQMRESQVAEFLESQGGDPGAEFGQPGRWKRLKGGMTLKYDSKAPKDASTVNAGTSKKPPFDAKNFALAKEMMTQVIKLHHEISQQYKAMFAEIGAKMWPMDDMQTSKRWKDPTFANDHDFGYYVWFTLNHPDYGAVHPLTVLDSYPEARKNKKRYDKFQADVHALWKKHQRRQRAIVKKYKGTIKFQTIVARDQKLSHRASTVSAAFDGKLRYRFRDEATAERFVDEVIRRKIGRAVYKDKTAMVKTSELQAHQVADVARSMQGVAAADRPDSGLHWFQKVGRLYFHDPRTNAHAHVVHMNLRTEAEVAAYAKRHYGVGMDKVKIVRGVDPPANSTEASHAASVVCPVSVKCSGTPEKPVTSLTFASARRARRFASLCMAAIPDARVTARGKRVTVSHEDSHSAQVLSLATQAHGLRGPGSVRVRAAASGKRQVVRLVNAAYARKFAELVKKYGGQATYDGTDRVVVSGDAEAVAAAKRAIGPRGLTDAGGYENSVSAATDRSPKQLVKDSQGRVIEVGATVQVDGRTGRVTSVWEVPRTGAVAVQVAFPGSTKSVVYGPGVLRVTTSAKASIVRASDEVNPNHHSPRSFNVRFKTREDATEFERVARSNRGIAHVSGDGLTVWVRQLWAGARELAKKMGGVAVDAHGKPSSAPLSTVSATTKNTIVTLQFRSSNGMYAFIKAMRRALRAEYKSDVNALEVKVIAPDIDAEDRRVMKETAKPLGGQLIGIGRVIGASTVSAATETKIRFTFSRANGASQFQRAVEQAGYSVAQVIGRNVSVSAPSSASDEIEEIASKYGGSLGWSASAMPPVVRDAETRASTAVSDKADHR